MRLRLVLAALSAIAFGGVARAVDVLELKDGRVLFGWVVEETPKDVKFETMVANVKTVMTFKRKDVVRLELDPVRPGELEEEEAAAPEEGLEAPEIDVEGGGGAPPEGAAALAPRKRYVLVPIEGTFGEKVFADGVRDALRAAVGAGVQDVVFQIRSGGGQLREAQGIAAVMKEFDDQLFYHAIVDEAFSACVWVLSLCDSIFIRPNAATGAAVAYSINMDTGAAEVDAKLLSALAADVAAQAESKGKQGAIFKAMIVPELELWTWRDGFGRLMVSNSAPPTGTAGARKLDDKTTVLSLTGADAVALGFAAFLDEKANIGAALDGQEWTLLSDVGRQSMQRAVMKRERAIATVNDLAEEINKRIEEAERAIANAERLDPRSSQTYFYDPRTGYFTAQSQADWRNNTKKAIAAWGKAQSELRSLDRLAQRFFQLYGERLKLEFAIDKVMSRAEDEIKWLKENQNRNRP